MPSVPYDFVPASSDAELAAMLAASYMVMVFTSWRVGLRQVVFVLFVLSAAFLLSDWSTWLVMVTLYLIQEVFYALYDAFYK